jgi:hypothetical protein
VAGAWLESAGPGAGLSGGTTADTVSTYMLLRRKKRCREFFSFTSYKGLISAFFHHRMAIDLSMTEKIRPVATRAHAHRKT